MYMRKAEAAKNNQIMITKLGESEKGVQTKPGGNGGGPPPHPHIFCRSLASLVLWSVSHGALGHTESVLEKTATTPACTAPRLLTAQPILIRTRVNTLRLLGLHSKRPDNNRSRDTPTANNLCMPCVGLNLLRKLCAIKDKRPQA